MAVCGLCLLAKRRVVKCVQTPGRKNYFHVPDAEDGHTIDAPMGLKRGGLVALTFWS